MKELKEVGHCSTREEDGKYVYFVTPEVSMEGQ